MKAICRGFSTYIAFRVQLDDPFLIIINERKAFAKTGVNLFLPGWVPGIASAKDSFDGITPTAVKAVGPIS